MYILLYNSRLNMLGTYNFVTKKAKITKVQYFLKLYLNYYKTYHFMVHKIHIIYLRSMYKLEYSN